MQRSAAYAEPWSEQRVAGLSWRVDPFLRAGQGVTAQEFQHAPSLYHYLYALSEGEFVSYILGAPDFVTQPFRDLFADGLPLMTPLVARSEGPPGDR